ncbi:hypothetical protein DNHGIG_10640 [Collibacillus ludicampi]|uniref:Uncharacterized protein n=1 Tax=Collibacillus ludicampi TaxID=2771369 RepID=A0AAV4LCG9_9BACL|nr:hypothetical protein DNHGIG_10640 [Collibacillus ludicampi]
MALIFVFGEVYVHQEIFGNQFLTVIFFLDVKEHYSRMIDKLKETVSNPRMKVVRFMNLLR